MQTVPSDLVVGPSFLQLRPLTPHRSPLTGSPVTGEAVLQTGKLSHLTKGAQLANEKQVRFESRQPSPGGSVSKESACSAGDRVQSLGREDPLVRGMETHSSILSRRIPRTEEPSRLQSMWLKESDMTE